jgi:hypothetical protein
VKPILALKKPLRLHVEDVNEAKPNDISYVYSGYSLSLSPPLARSASPYLCNSRARSFATLRPAMAAVPRS